MIPNIKKLCVVLFFLIFFIFAVSATLEVPFQTQFCYENIYHFKADGTIIMTNNENVLINESLENKAQLISAWERDCTSENRKIMEEALALFLNMSQVQNLDENQKRVLTDFSEAYKVMIRSLQCKFKANPDGNTADINYFAEWSAKDIETIYKGFSGVDEKEYFIKIERRENITIAKIPRPQKTVRKLKFLLEGRLVQMIPTYNERDGNYYVISDAHKMKNSEIYVTFRVDPATPAPQATQKTNNKPPSPSPTIGKIDKNSVNFLGIEVPMNPKDMFWLVGIIISLIGILILLAFIRFKLKSGKEGNTVKRERELVTWVRKDGQQQKAVAEMTKESQEPKKTLFASGEVTSPASKPLPKENDVFVETKPYVFSSEKPKTESIIESSRETLQTNDDTKRENVKKEELSEADLKTIERAIAALEPTKAKYQPEQLRKVMLEMGYKEHIAEYIINKLYKK